MGSIELCQFSRLGENHIGDCLALSAAADWNQTSADWDLFLRHGCVLGLPAGHAGKGGKDRQAEPLPDALTDELDVPPQDDRCLAVVSRHVEGVTQQQGGFGTPSLSRSAAALRNRRPA